MNYYNEFDPYAAQWLRNLIAEGLIPAGDVDTRSITDVQPDDLAGYRQCHFFAGIGGWSLAARLAGWPDDRELWTGSAPCQPFSVAGKGKAQADDRHLWPHLFRLARSRRPAVLMGEQVAAAVGKDWIDGVFTDLEGIGYACGASVSRLVPSTRPTSVIAFGLWPTMTSNSPAKNGNNEAGNSAGQVAIRKIMLGLWSTLRASDGEKGGPNQSFGAGGCPLPSQVFQVGSSSNAPTENGAGSLHPEFGGWELGFPPEWDACAPMEMPSRRKLPRK
ncbi:DNA cytosine methyltransferase [Stenotrophomonas sp. AS1]|uniref:DNA cytosine methyltransferase n=1 Tax=Stenotrophomonas sp. AS1 TaxID=3029188 RepID=UPI003B78CA5F